MRLAGMLLMAFGAAWEGFIYWSGAWPTALPFAAIALGVIILAIGFFRR